MVFSDSNGRNLEPRGHGQVGYKSLSVEATLANPAELCGIYESVEEPRKLDPISQTMVFYMLEVRVPIVNLIK